LSENDKEVPGLIDIIRQHDMRMLLKLIRDLVRWIICKNSFANLIFRENITND
jgi:hypothetical protein